MRKVICCKSLWIKKYILPIRQWWSGRIITFEPFVSSFDPESTAVVQMCEPLKQNLHFSRISHRNFTVLNTDSITGQPVDSPP